MSRPRSFDVNLRELTRPAAAILLYEKPLRKKRESSEKSSRRIVTQRPNTCSARSLRSDRVRAKAQPLRSDQMPIPLGHYVATKLEPELGRYVATERLFCRYVATELEPKFGRYIATELFRNVDTTSVHAFASTLRYYLPNTVANPSHIPRHFQFINQTLPLKLRKVHSLSKEAIINASNIRNLWEIRVFPNFPNLNGNRQCEFRFPHADPTESAARQERLRIAEEQGELEATAIMMVQASINALPPSSPSGGALSS
ncbi:hypothetical protein F2Q69_00021038 [Brassica cretica]|uniref:Uncharacterized protein n=1 Tax=Brassica cretica TaxID=69181 RepID=A0A8S9Q7B9_BRACR|nr:hypothetical protein F2Q69_00021038 [Brassica cretica]